MSLRKFIARGRGQGKTTELILRSASDQGYIVVHSQNEARRVAEQARNLGHVIPFPLTYVEFVNRSFYGQGIKSFHIDNVDRLVQHIAGSIPVMSMTYTTEDEEE